MTNEPSGFDLLNLAAAIGRQWVVLLLGLLIAAGGTFIVMEKLPPTYQATGTVVLIPPGTAESGVNPYDRFTSAYNILATVMADSVIPEDTVARLKARGLTSTYTVTTDPVAPTITVAATDTDPVRAQTTMNGVINEMATFLLDREKASGTDRSKWVTVAPLSVPTTPIKTAATLRIAIIVAVLGLIAAVSIAALSDRAATDRRRRLEAARRPVEPGWQPVAAPVPATPAAPGPAVTAASGPSLTAAIDSPPPAAAPVQQEAASPNPQPATAPNQQPVPGLYPQLVANRARALSQE